MVPVLEAKGGGGVLRKFFQSRKEEKIYAPVDGKIIKLEDVPDPVFGKKMMGEGIAVVPENGEFVSPVSGKVVHVADTKHAIGLETKRGTEILIHIGLETVERKGKGFTVHVRSGDDVAVGQQLLDADLQELRKHADMVTPIVITNSSDSGKNYVLTDEKEAKAGETVLMMVRG